MGGRSSLSASRGGMGGAGSLGGGITVSSSICTGRTPVRGREEDGARRVRFVH